MRKISAKLCVFSELSPKKSGQVAVKKEKELTTERHREEESEFL